MKRTRPPAAGTALLVALLFLLTVGCATRGYVNEEVRTQLAELRSDMESTDQELRTEIAENEEIAQTAKREAMEASRDLSRVRRLALGNTNLEEAGRYQVYFGFDSAELDDQDRQVLDRVASRVADEKGLVVDVYGFADPTGPDQYNYRLGRKRADVVARYLIDQGAFPITRLQTISFGENYPDHKDPGDVGHSELRQVLVLVMERTAPAEEEEGTTGKEDVLSKK